MTTCFKMVVNVSSVYGSSGWVSRPLLTWTCEKDVGIFGDHFGGISILRDPNYTSVMSAALKQIPVKVKGQYNHIDLGRVSQPKETQKESLSCMMLFISAFGAPRWATFLKYGRVELMPPSPADIPTAIGQAVRLAKGAATFQWRKVTVRVRHVLK